MTGLNLEMYQLLKGEWWLSKAEFSLNTDLTDEDKKYISTQSEEEKDKLKDLVFFLKIKEELKLGMYWFLRPEFDKKEFKVEDIKKKFIEKFSIQDDKFNMKEIYNKISGCVVRHQEQYADKRFYTESFEVKKSLQEIVEFNHKFLMFKLQRKFATKEQLIEAYGGKVAARPIQTGLNKFREELAETAKKICTPGKGILAADESEGTIGKKFVTINVENNSENRRNYRELLFSTEGIEQYVSGVILYSETASKHATKDGVPFVEALLKKGIVPGIKVDKGLQNIPGTQDETSTKGLDSLDAMCKEYYALGCRFAKWRTTLKIGNGCPSAEAIHENAWGLARYASICQNNGLVPIVEPEILSDGDHSIQTAQKVTEKVLAAVMKALQDQGIFFEGCLLKPAMVTPGKQFPDANKVSHKEIAERTVTALSRTCYPALVGVTFLSGGMSEEDASLNLNAINQTQGVRRPWTLTFSFGRALQNTVIKTWAGKAENFKKAQDALIIRAKANSQAQLGQYKGSSDKGAKESLYVENYKY